MSWKKTLAESSETLFVLLLGPTASGKSDLGFELQREAGGLVLNADAIQCYQEVEIGAAKPPLELRSRPNVHLFDWVPPPKTMTAREYAEKAWSVVDAHKGSGPVFFVGGSGFYLKALEWGMLDVPPSGGQLSLELELRGEKEMFAELERLDPERAEVISPRDHYRLLRSLEVVRSTGKTFSQLQKEREASPSGLRSRGRVLKVALEAPKVWLKDRVALRTEKMLSEGWVQEVTQLLERGLEDWWPLKSVGYREIVQHLKGDLKSSELHDEIVKRTMDLAKRQRTWSRGLKDITMVDATRPLKELTQGLLKDF